MMQVVPSALDAVLSSLQKVKPAGPQKWMACCPAHDDRERSLSVRSSDGRILFRCFVGCSFEAICGALGMSQREMFADTEEETTGVRKREREDVPTATLAELAAARKLPVGFLQGLGWSDGQGVIRIAYKRRNGAALPTRIRRGHSGSKGVWWDPRGNPGAYEPDSGALAREERYLILCEGESDTATLLYAGFPALGVPGASLVASVVQAEHVEGVERVFYVREPDRGGDEFDRLIPARLKELGFEGGVYAIKMPDAAKDPSALFVRDPEAFPGKLRAVLDKARSLAESGGIEWRSAHEVFGHLPPVEWRVRGLQLCPGRPAMLAGYGASAKTLSAQSMALACASGAPVWGFFETEPMQVRHLDYEQGWRATARRYQRLAAGHGIDPREVADRLKVAIFPHVYLDSPGAIDSYAKMCSGVDFVILDALRGATPTQDENDSRIRACIDNLTRVSEKTGTAFLLLHHAGKPQQNGSTDARIAPRGSSGIFDACGSVFAVTAGGADEPRLVRHIKPPAEAEGLPVQDFHLLVQDVAGPTGLTHGVRVVHETISVPTYAERAVAKDDERKQAVMSIVRSRPGMSKSAIARASGITKPSVLGYLGELERDGAITVLPEGQAEKVFPSPNQRRPLG